ncbi:MAG TPA: crossover junction endodeoxyribonuclease RuvC [Geminicoccus sp.]|jgi:crossover junction endodeoxyribonuclease RuvC|uniref:crossover junction endodeoxyribonuclease RuvC n=1 Tax=Geminicoccus sp. TaxID=2024832 RepID=UPI002E36D4B2|nr:crossover junction endodeoxyribonuclease RuvC [Geminicoccus sp.]HEX2528085.1 crossover junction endodeoxyribonuclease RuvC [Geminicoccus sp.]
MLVLGLDPGLRHTGWGVVEAVGNRLRFVAAGVLDTDAQHDLAVRLVTLHAGLIEVVAKYQPTVAAVEETVVNKNAASSLKLGHARGVIMFTAASAGMSVAEYPSKTVKRAVVGTGAAEKEQVAAMIRILLPGAGFYRSDATDALAVAVCHANRTATTAAIGRSMRSSIGGAT